MLENACLHIQARDAERVQVVTLPGVSIRIGRASYCEVRLPEADVADEECHLKRRGQIWHLVPVGRPGSVRIDDDPVEQSRPLPFGVPFRVGDHRLILQTSGDALSPWGSFARPIPLDVPTAGTSPAHALLSRPQAERVRIDPPPRPEPPATGTGPAPDDDRPARRQVRQEPPDRLLQTRQQGRRWEERWKAAGERLRTRAHSITPPTPRASTPTPSAKFPEPGLSATRRPEVRARTFSRRPEPAPPPPSVAREVPATSPPIPVIPSPTTAPLDGRAALAPSDWSRAPTPIPTRPDPKPTPALKRRPRGAPAPVPAIPNEWTGRRSFAATGPLDEPAPVDAESRQKTTIEEPECRAIRPELLVCPVPSVPITEPILPESGSYPAPWSDHEATEPAATEGSGTQPLACSPVGQRVPGPIPEEHETHGFPLARYESQLEDAAEAETSETAPLDGSDLVPKIDPPASGGVPGSSHTRVPPREGEIEGGPSLPELGAVGLAKVSARDPGPTAPTTGSRHETPATPGRTTEVFDRAPQPGNDPETTVEGRSPVPEVLNVLSQDETPNGVEAVPWSDDEPFVADTRLARDEGWAGPGLFTNTTATTTAPDPDPAKVTPTQRASSRRSRQATTQTTAPRSRPARSSGSDPFAASSLSATAATETEAVLEIPDAGPWVRDPLLRLPRAREILDAHRNVRAVTKAARPVQRRRAVAEPLPTVSREPAHWTIPLWLGWIPAMAGALALGLVSVILSWNWSIDAERAGFLANRLDRIRAGVGAGGGGGNGTKADPLPEWVKPPEPNWWKTTAGHLTLWALQRDRTANDPDAAEDAREFLEAAAQSSPLQARVRFARSRQGPALGTSISPASSLALSRDVVALAWTGHQLLGAGKKEPALRAYRAALEMAAKADLSRLALPMFNDDTQVRRYALPAEDLISPIVRDLAERGGGNYAEWSAALPRFAVVQLAAARLLLERSSPDAEGVVEAILAQADVPPPAGTTSAVHVAAIAEALALKGRWAEAERRYRQAIDLMPDPSFRRSWWMNLAEIALRLSDESGRQKALEAARGTDPNDDITRRAVEQLKYYGVRTERLGSPTAQDLTASGIP